ncbi:MAG: DUF2520 domain-containing protein [Actinomycetota bacterium]|nr:DUF2520 domain-containing protein [Actinomycetota bacterium]
MDVAVVGAGRVGTAVAVLLAGVGHRIVAVSGREASRARASEFLPEAPFLPTPQAVAEAEVVLLTVPDDAIAEVAREVAPSLMPGAAVAHLSGALGLDVLEPARAVDARPLSIHPLQTVPDVEAGIQGLPGSYVAVTADDEDTYRIGEGLAADLGARAFRLPDDRKPLYHAAAVFCSNYLVAVEAIAERLFGLAGIEEPLQALAPLARASLANALDRGPTAALTGPAARGDAGTIQRHLEALQTSAPHSIPAYLALAEAALHLASAAGHLDPVDAAGVQEVIDRWR